MSAGVPSKISRRELLALLPGTVGCVCCSAALAREWSSPFLLADPDPTRDEGALRIDETQRKSRDFDVDYADDSYLPENRLALLRAVSDHLRRIRNFIGFGRFSIVGFDQMLRFGVRYAEIGGFDRGEIDFIDEIFSSDAKSYGFFGARVTTDLSTAPAREDLKKIGQGHYLYRGSSLETYQRLARDLEKALILTSGVRGVVKQLQLFVEKVDATGGNLSRASRSLAPPGYSYHAVGDFDVGRPGVGLPDFTESFAQTEEYRRMADLGYAKTRYSSSNQFGVRYEPWHIKVD